MALLKILIFPDPRLRTKAKSVQNIDGSIKELSDDMLETMYEGEGIGLAATQINVVHNTMGRAAAINPTGTIQ